ncbi:MAG: hypothetical protein AAGG38_10610 [Planctomycetota bacterium]
MAKQDLSRHQEGIVKRYYQNHETIQATKLGELVSELWLADDAKTQTKLWGKAQVALMRLGVDATRVAKVVSDRDVEALGKLAQQADAPGSAKTGRSPGVVDRGATTFGGGHKGTAAIDGSAIKAVGARSAAEQPGGARTISQMRAEKAAEAGFDSLEEPNLKRAMKAFRRKLKNYRRDDESRLGSRQLTAGRSSSISAIEPPKEFPRPVWDKLVELGRLKRSGGGTYELP